MSPKREAPSAPEWERHKAQIERLYHSETLDYLVREMESAGFFATPAMYKTKFRNWGWRKYISHELAVEAAKKRARREEDGRPATVILIDGKEVPESRINRHVKRHRADLAEGGPRVSESEQAESSLAASRVTVTTPVNHTNSPAAVTIVQAPEHQDISSFDPASSHRPQILTPPAPQAPVEMLMGHPFVSSSANAATNGVVADNRSLRASEPGFPVVPFSLGPSGDMDGPDYQSTGMYQYNLDIEQNELFSSPNDISLFDFSAFDRYGLTLGQGDPGWLVPPRNLPKTRQPIHQAAQNGHTKIVKLLLRAKRDCVDLEGQSGETPLILAAEHGHTEIVEALLAAGANPNAFHRESGRRCIHQAAQGGHLECLRLLLANGARANETDSGGVTALTLAAQEGSVEMLEELFDAGANPNVYEQKSLRGGIHQAAQGGHLECVRLLLAKAAKADEPDTNGVTPLMLACRGGYAEVVRLILSKRPETNVNAGLPSGRRALHLAAQSGHLETVQLLITAGALVNQGEEEGATALWLACQEGHLETAELLAKNKADLNNATLVSHRRPIHQAAQNGHLKIVQFLHSRQADLDSGEVDGASPLWLASQQGHADIVEFLLTHGANPNSRTIKSSRYPLHQAAQNNHASVVAALIRHKANVNAVEEDGWPPLMLAAQQGHIEVAQLLIDNGAEVNLAELKGGTALWIAAQQGHLRVAEMLLKRQATLTACSPTGRQPIHQAAQNGHLEMVKMLVEWGSKADCQVLGGEGSKITPLWLASQGGHDAIVEFLLEKGASPVIG